jgi:hypothetical protein
MTQDGTYQVQNTPIRSDTCKASKPMASYLLFQCFNGIIAINNKRYDNSFALDEDANLGGRI